LRQNFRRPGGRVQALAWGGYDFGQDVFAVRGVFVPIGPSASAACIGRSGGGSSKLGEVIQALRELIEEVPLSSQIGMNVLSAWVELDGKIVLLELCEEGARIADVLAYVSPESCMPNGGRYRTAWAFSLSNSLSRKRASRSASAWRIVR
jgi:hypothetical protein